MEEFWGSISRREREAELISWDIHQVESKFIFYCIVEWLSIPWMPSNIQRDYTCSRQCLPLSRHHCIEQPVYTPSPVLVSHHLFVLLSSRAFYWIKNDESVYLDRSYSVGVDALTSSIRTSSFVVAPNAGFSLLCARPALECHNLVPSPKPSLLIAP